MIIQLQPYCDFSLLDIIIEEQQAYFGAHNSHIIIWMYWERKIQLPVA